MNIATISRALDKLELMHQLTNTSSRLNSIASEAKSGISNSTHQKTYKASLSELIEDLSNQTASDFFDYEISILKDRGLEYLLPTELALQIHKISVENQATLQVISDEISLLEKKFDADIKNISSLLEAMDSLKIEPFNFDGYPAAITAYFPSNSFDDSLDKLGNRFKKTQGALSKIVKLSANGDDLNIVHISGGSALVVLGSSLAAAATIALVLERLASAFEKYQSGLKISSERKAIEINNAELRLKIDEATERDITLNEEILSARVQQISVEVASKDVPNSEIGIKQAIMVLVQQLIDGVDYDVIANLEANDGEENEEQILGNVETITLINDRSNREQIRRIRDIETELVLRIVGPD